MKEHVDEGTVPAGAGVALQLGMSCVLAASAAVVFVSLAGLRPVTIAVSIVGGGALGLFCTVTLQRNLYLIGLALERMTRMLPVEPLHPWPRWPLGDMLSRVNILNTLLGEQAQRERETHEYREQLLEQVGSAAAQGERNRLARELHDSIKQQIFSISMSAAAAEARWESDPPGAQGAIADVRRSAQEALVEMEALLQQLRPAVLESVGLREALQVQCEALSYRIAAEVTLEHFDLPPDDVLLPAVQEALFRMVQEGLSNVARHARARHVSIWLGQQDGALQLRIRDDGQGFEPDRLTSGAGLAGVRERAQSLGGNLEIESVPGTGTLLHVHVPLRRPPSVGVEVDELDREMERLREERKKAIAFGTLVEQITVLLIFLGAPISAVLLGLGVSLFTYGRLRFLGTQMAVRPGHGQSDDRRQEYQESGLLAAALGIASLCIFYLFVAERSWHVHFQTWQVLVAALVIEALALVVTIRWYRGIDHYLGHLPRAERQDAAQHRVRSVRDSLGLWLIVLIIALIAGLSPGFPPRSSNQWADGSALAVLAVWPLLDAVDYLLTTRWQKRLRAAAT